MKRIIGMLMVIIILSGAGYKESLAKTHAYAMKINKIRYSDNGQLSPDDISAAGAVLIEQNSRKVLFQKDSNKRMYPASTTKLLTALVAIENGDLKEIITVGDEIKLMDPGSSRAWLKIGERMKLSDLLMGLMLPSGNDAAYTIAVNIGRRLAINPSLKGEEALKIFVDKMNERAAEIGAKDSHFVNPHGIHNNEHYTTPYDLALIAREALKHDFFRQVVGTYKYDGISINNQVHGWVNTNKLLDEGSSSYYEYATGIKTGFTTPAGYCLVSSASRGGMDVIAVILNATKVGQFADSRRLLSYGLDSFTHHEVIKKGEVIKSVKVSNKLPWDESDFDIIASESFADVLSRADIPNIKFELVWDSRLIKSSGKGEEGIELLTSLKKGVVIGRAVYTLKGEVLGETIIEAGRDIGKRYWLFYIPGAMFVYENRYYILPGGMFLTICLILAGYKKTKRKKKRNIK